MNKNTKSESDREESSKTSKADEEWRVDEDGIENE